MTKESIYELQRIDCNCNDCGFLRRDFNKFKLSDLFHNDLLYAEFIRNKNNDLFIAYTIKERTLIKKAEKQKYQPSQPPVKFGFCKKFDFKEVSFIPGVCQIETQKCFVHRKDYQA